MTRAINAAGLALIKEYEGLKLHAYLDGAGVITIGYGHTAGVKIGDVCSQQDADNWLAQDLNGAEGAVSRLVKVVLTDNQFSALVSFTFNMGAGRLAGSTLLKKLNGGNYRAVPRELAKWCNVDGHASAGLARRRAAEGALWSINEGA